MRNLLIKKTRGGRGLIVFNLYSLNLIKMTFVFRFQLR
jgi:hypothetical protein